MPAQSCSPKMAHGGGGHPVHERGLVEEADAVDVGGDEVVAVEHLAGDLDVDGVDVVEKAGGEDAAELEDEPGEDEDGDGAWAPAADWCELTGGLRMELELRFAWRGTFANGGTTVEFFAVAKSR